MKIFVAGTDTGVGKTTISVALLSAFRTQGRSVVAIKPIETGCTEVGDQLHPEDGANLWRAQGGQGMVPPWVCRHRYVRPASPQAAARAAGLPAPELDVLVQDWQKRSSGVDFALAEGAGGLLVPIDHERTTCELIRRLQAPVLVVGRAGLGTINHTLLTVSAARERGLRVLGFVLNGWRDNGELEFARENARDIEMHGSVSCLGLFPWLEDPMAEGGAAAAKWLSAVVQCD